MNSKPHRNNSDFQLRHFLAGDCKTPDGAWALMYSQKIDMESKIRHSDSQRMRRDAKIAAAEEIIADPASKRSERLDAQADILETQADVTTWELNLQAAKNELATIEGIMAELEPLRKYAHLPILEASEACQREEWLLELMGRAETFLVSQGTIPWDHLNTMSCHPDFKSHIVPHINQLTASIRALTSAGDGLLLLTQGTVLPEVTAGQLLLRKVG